MMLMVILGTWAALSVPVCLILGAVFGLGPASDGHEFAGPTGEVGRRPGRVPSPRDPGDYHAGVGPAQAEVRGLSS